jgi:hypothetical protein
VDERALRDLLAKGERELDGKRQRSAGALWAAAAATLTVFALYLAVLIGRTAPFGGLRSLLVGTTGAFGLLALYCWVRLVASKSRR